MHDYIRAGEAYQANLTPGGLSMADAVYLGNSLRGLIHAVPFYLTLISTTHHELFCRSR